MIVLGKRVYQFNTFFCQLLPHWFLLFFNRNRITSFKMDCSAYNPLSICHTHEYFRLRWIWQLFIANKQICKIKAICRKVKPECWSNGDAISIPISTQVALSESPFLQDETGYFGGKILQKVRTSFHTVLVVNL